ncbi:hypothetical protein [Streptomyces sp. AC495_CC817]|uniref:hypothetical protein n=1 Tax=Streptomyces sp. AC495_CC817 TaxID=2823900 RepID=UPI001C255A21|nr:hypothetical protein [Streptomyces sp. AC495_CC817]
MTIEAHPIRPTRLAVASIAMVGAVGVFTGCAAQQVEVPADVRAALASVSVLPADLYMAHGIVVNRCLNEAGFDIPFDASASLTNATRHVAVGVVGVFPSEQSARANGYNTTFENEGATSLEDYQSSLSAGEQAKFDEALWGPEDAPRETLVVDNGMEFGKSTVGCAAEGDDAVYGSVRGAMMLELFTNDVSAQTQTYRGDFDATLKALMPEYESCMSEAGYDVEGLTAPQVAEAAFGRYRETGAGPSAEEQKMAVADFQCQDSVQLSEKLNDLFVERASAWLVENEDRILELSEHLDESLDRAQGIING